MRVEYTAVNHEGRTISGNIVVNSLREATRKLQAQGLSVLSVEAKEEKQATYQAKRVTPSALAVFIGQLATLLESDIAIDEAVTALKETEENDRIRDACRKILSRVRNGEPFSMALKASGLPLPPYFHLLAEAGEVTGNPGQAMRSALKQWEYDLETRRRLAGALLYPSILIFTGITAVLLIFVLVVPRFESILAKTNNGIPAITKIILVSGTFFNDHIVLSGAIATLIIIGPPVLFKNKMLRNRLFELTAKMPLLSGWMHEIELGRWAAMMATLTESQVELTHALNLSSQFIHPANMRNQFQRLAGAVRAGSSLSEALDEKQLLSPAGVNLIRVGEHTGKLPQMLNSLAKLLDTSVKNRTGRILALTEPIAILLIGAVIGVIMAGLILGITSMNETV